MLDALFEAVLWVIGELLWQLIAELVFGAVRAFLETLIDADFAGNRGRLSPVPAVKLGWYLVIGAAGGGASILAHPARLGVPSWMRIAALVVLPIASGIALATWDGMRGKTGEGRGRAAFWAGTAFGVGYVLVRLVVGLAVPG